MGHLHPHRLERHLEEPEEDRRHAGQRLFSRDRIDVLLRLNVKPGDTRVHADGDHPLAWAKMYGKGRVFFGSFAHTSATWDIRNIQQMYFEAIRWSLGLTDADPAPHPLRGSAADLATGRGRGAER